MDTRKLFFFMSFVLVTTPLSAAQIVINTTDLTNLPADDGLCTLVEAIDAANTNLASGQLAGECAAGEAHPVVDEITFDNAILPAYFATFETYTLSESIHLKGPAKELVTFAGIAQSRILEISNLQADAEFIISDVTFADTSIRLPASDYGAAIWAYHISGASLTIERVDFLRNNSERGGGAIGLYAGSNNTTTIRDSYFSGNFVQGIDQTVAGGGAVFIGGQQNVIIENSTFANNTATNLAGNNPLDDAAGGAILVRANGAAFVSTVEITQSTFSENIADGVGGALAMGGPGYPLESAEVTLRHNTWVANQADFNNDQTGNDSGGGAIYSSSSAGVNLKNNLIAGNSDQSQSAAPELTGGFITFGNNLIGNNQQISTTFPAGQPNINDDFVGEPPVIILPLVSPLADNGGPTPTRQLLINSVAVDQGKCNALTSDQRGQYNDQSGLRSVDQPGISDFFDGCDIGAVELGSIASDPLPVATADSYILLEGATLTLTAANGVLSNDVDDDPLVVISAGQFSTSTGDAQGQLTLRPDGALQFQADDADGYGVTTFDYTITDLFNRSTITSEFIVEPVNDAPFYSVSSETVAGIQGQFITVNNWATDLSAGPTNEAGQQLVFAVDVSAAPVGFFSGFPAIDPGTGDLTFELAADASGQALVDISLRDDGGVVNGGQDTYTRAITFVVSDVIFANSFE
ncbi:choice-of-anchor Q domain-containing protein [Marinicella sediminis]|nr:choice-of-anchor Q domain-containing protein [Marinicella sediminis]